METRRIAILLWATILLGALSARAEDPVNIPDPALKAAIEAQLGIPNPTPSDMLALASLHAPNQGITDLTGLEHAKSLTNLSLSSNRITDISALRELTAMKTIELGRNQITDISPLAGMVALTRLNLYDNCCVADISPLSGLTQLAELTLGNNYEISDITPLAGLTNLTSLHVDGNKIVDISVIAGLTNLKHLFIGRNQISDISPLAGLTGLTSLSLTDNPLDDADMPVLAGMTNMTNLQLGNYYTRNFQLSDISVVANMPRLTQLYLYCDTLDDITPLAGLTEMTGLDLGGEKIDSISSLAGMTELVYFSLWNTQVSDVSVLTNFTKLTGLNLRCSRITDLRPLAELTALTELRLDGNQIADIGPLAGLTNLTYLRLTDNWLTDIQPLAGLTNLTELYLDTNAYADTARYPTHNQISDISALAGLTDLRVLHLGSNWIRDLSPLVELPNLSSLYLWSCGLTDISTLTAMTSLNELWLDGNPLNAKACAIDIPLIQANNPGVVVHYDGCTQWWTLTVSSTEGGSVVMPGEDAFVYFAGDLAPVEAVAQEGYEFAYWSGTAVDANAMLDPCAPHTSVTVDADYSLTAHFKPQDQPWSTVYFNDFEDQAGPEWSRSTIPATPIGERRFLGQFGNSTATLTLTDLPSHTRMRVSFDLFVIRSWNGNEVQEGAGPDHWMLTVDDETLLNTTFANRPSSADQAFPGNYPDEQYPPQTGAAEVDSLGYMYFDFIGPTSELPQSAVYHMVFTVEHETDATTVSFSASGLEGLDNESWGLDNVRIEVLDAEAEVEAQLTISSTAGGSVVVPGEGAFLFSQGESVAIEAIAEAGYSFTHWSGSAVDAGKVAGPDSASTTVLMDGDCELVANFTLNQTTLTISSMTGGSVLGPGEGAFQFAPGESVIVQASTDEHYFFTHWSGTAVEAGKVANPGSQYTTVVVDADYTLVANFRIGQHRLTVSANEGGYVTTTVQIDGTARMWPGDRSLLFDYGTEVTITATPYGGWFFENWAGTMGSTESRMTFALTQDHTLEANFKP